MSPHLGLGVEAGGSRGSPVGAFIAVTSLGWLVGRTGGFGRYGMEVPFSARKIPDEMWSGGFRRHHVVRGIFAPLTKCGQWGFRWPGQLGRLPRALQQSTEGYGTRKYVLLFHFASFSVIGHFKLLMILFVTLWSGGFSSH